MILTDREIRAFLASQQILIDPLPADDQFSSTSIDLTLDAHIQVWNENLVSCANNPPVFAPSAGDFLYKNVVAQFAQTMTITQATGHVLNPGQFLLGWTAQHVELPLNSRLAARVEGKSSLARLGVVVHLTAPTIHAGFEGQIQLEFCNLGPLHIRLLRFSPDYAGEKWFADGEQMIFQFNVFCYVKGMKTTNHTADDFSSYCDEELEGSYDCVDRMVVNAYHRMGQTAAGFRTWWRQLYGSDKTLDRTHIMRMAGDFNRRLRGAAKKYAIPVVYVPMGERKDTLWEQYRPEAPDFKGVFLILISRAPAPVWEVKRRKGKIIDIARKSKWPYVNYFYFHIMDPDWGHMLIRMSSYPPFGAQIILNGHEWVACQARKQGVPIHKTDNCFVEGSEYQALERIAKALRDPTAIGQLLRACDRWVYSSALCFGLSQADQERSMFRYSYSFFQLEYSRNLLFKRGRRMDEIFQQTIERTRGKLDVKRLKTIFGFKHRPCQIQSRGKKAVQLEMTIERPAYNLTVFKLRWGNLVLKMYDKGGRVLRTEAVAHNVKSLRCGKGADKWELLVERMQDMMLAFMNTLQAAHVAFLDDGALEAMAKPSRHGSRRLAGLDMNKARIRSVADALLALCTRPNGFTARHLVQHLREKHTCHRGYGQRQAVYDLAKFTAKGLVSHERRGRYYQIRPAAVRALMAYLIIREQVLKPILAGVGRKRLGRHPKNMDPIDQHYLNLRSELFATLDSLGIAA